MNSKIVFIDKKMIIPTKTGTIYRYYSELKYVIFDKPYCSFHFADGDIYIVEDNLCNIMENLPEDIFLKCKRAAILNVCYCKELKTNPPTALMRDGKEIRLSKCNVPDFKNMMINAKQASPLCKKCYACINEKCVNRDVICQNPKKND